MPDYSVQSFVTAQEQAVAVSAASNLSMLVHKLLGGDRVEEPQSINAAMANRISRGKAAGKVYGSIAGYSIPTVRGTEVRLLLSEDIATELIADSLRPTPRLSAAETITVQTAYDGRQTIAPEGPSAAEKKPISEM